MARVLIAEDEEDLAEMLAEAIRSTGHDVTVVHDGAGALSAIAGAPDGPGAFDLLVLDRSMPVLGGDTVARVLSNANSPTRILMLTARSTAADTVEGLDLGADEYMTKPFD
ncbi:MAG: response regulator [Bifidobacteriaceae bacterium]|jgi:DNA-binding response OmpR family regulator|nr:response regulator [Bifidobacteriaceae bacterium]